MFKSTILALLAVATVQETQAVQLQAHQRQKLDQAVENYVNAESGSHAEWGFLKNIVNIDRFFDSGVKAWASTEIYKLMSERLLFEMRG